MEEYNMLMEIVTKVCGKMELWMDMVYIHIKMGPNTLEIFSMGKKMVRASTKTLMEPYLKEYGKTAKEMAKVHLKLQD